MKVRTSVAILICAAGLELLSGSIVLAGDACFTATKNYRIHPLRGGQDRRDGWEVHGNAFSQCVHRAEAADNILRGRYPDTVYQLSLAATVGCHGC